MKNKNTGELQLSPELQQLLENTPSTEEVAASIRQDIIDFDSDPEFVAGFLKMQFVEDIYQAMHAKGMNRNQLAKKIGKSRQYVGRVLNENANFTLETLAEIACALDMNVAARLYEKNERMTILPIVNKPQVFSFSGYVKSSDTVKSMTGEENAGYIAA